MLEKRVLQNFAKLARGGIEVHKMSGMEGGENWSKIIICTLREASFKTGSNIGR